MQIITITKVTSHSDIILQNKKADYDENHDKESFLTYAH